MSNQQAINIEAVQSLAAANRDIVTTLAAQLVDDTEDTAEIKCELAEHIESLTMTAEAGNLQALSHHIREIGIEILNTDAQYSVQLACLLLQTIENLSECGTSSETEIEQQLKPLLEQFRSSLNGAAHQINTDEEKHLIHLDDVGFEPMATPIDMDNEIDVIDKLLQDTDTNAPNPINENSTLEDSFLDDPLLNDLLSDDLAFEDFPEEGSSDETDLLTSIAEELSALQPQLEKYAQDLVISKEKDFVQAKQSYGGLLERIINTAKACELQGLEFVCTFVATNLEDAQSISQDFSTLLINWPSAIEAHLLDPSNDDHCLAISDFLEQEDWPQPLTYRQLRELLIGLAETVEKTEGGSVEHRQAEATDNEVALSISDDANEELISAFLDEAPEHAEVLNSLVHTLFNTDGDSNKIHATISAAQRVAHTLKGSSHLLGVQGIANMAHQLEDIFEFLDLQRATPSMELCRSLAQACDCIEEMMDYLLGHSPIPTGSLDTLQQLINWALLVDQREIEALTQTTSQDPTANNVEDSSSAENSPIKSTPVEQSAEKISSIENPSIENNSTETKQENSQENAKQEVAQHDDTVRVSRTLLDNIFNIVGETSIALGQMQEQLKHLGLSSREIIQQEQAIQTRRFELENAVSVKGMSVKQGQSHNNPTEDENFDSLEMDDYDEFYGIAHSFIEVVSDSRLALKTLSKNVNELDGLSLSQQRLNSELQDLVISTRLEPVKTLSNRLQRCVRQACRMVDKNAELVIEGEQLMMDGDMLKKLADPLMHMLRNAVDHGIEDSNTRKENGKKEQGKITLHFQQQGNHILVSCNDDGHGLDYNAIRQKAISKGLLNDQDNPDDKALSRLLLHTGFSTRDETSQLSGRGVGMDVVNTAILNLKGTMDLGNNPEGGASVTLNLPVTMLTNHSLLVSASESRYAIPSNRLEQILSPGIGQLTMVADKPCYQLGEDIYPFTTLEQLIKGGAVTNIDNYSSDTILLIRGETETVAVAIDQAISSGELVIKSLGQYLSHVKSVAGMSLLGDGSLVPMLNISYLLATQNSDNVFTHDIHQPKASKQILPKVLIVDDSLSVRSALTQLMTDSGFEPLVARDGLEALDIIENDTPQLVLTDLEMPRMNGLELTNRIRMSEQSDIPVIMITSRTMQKHRDQANSSGVNHYLTKPFSEDDLVSVIQTQLANQTRHAS